MKIITEEVPEEYLEEIESQLVNCILNSRHFFTRDELRNRIRNLDLVIEKKKDISFYCINCNKPLHYQKLPYNNNCFCITEIRFCCECFERFKKRSFEEFPTSLIEKIKKLCK